MCSLGALFDYFTVLGLVGGARELLLAAVTY
jgi:hypothetical protein